LKSFVLASTNPGKIKDYQEMLRGHFIKLIPQSEFAVPEVEETGLTFVENALIKARHASLITGLPALGDDSGLVVDALDGAPGLYSARYAGKGANMEDNIQKLLAELSKKPNANRRARFYAVIVLLRYPHDPAPLICEGNWEGEILKQPQGEHGFGYLPIFYVPTHHCSGAELSQEERSKINHRGQAFRKLLDIYLTR
jgi:XTP/dITP diphosphohydrolase